MSPQFIQLELIKALGPIPYPVNLKGILYSVQDIFKYAVQLKALLSLGEKVTVIVIQELGQIEPVKGYILNNLS